MAMGWVREGGAERLGARAQWLRFDNRGAMATNSVLFLAVLVLYYT